MTDRRSTAQRVDQAKSLLQHEADAWIATASAQGEGHLVPLYLSWDGSSIILATEAGSATARNIAATGGARLPVGSTRDVVLIQASAIAVPCDEADESTCATFVSRTGWNRIKEAPGTYAKPFGHQSRRGAGDEAAILSHGVEGDLLQGHPHHWPQLAPQGTARGRPTTAASSGCSRLGTGRGSSGCYLR